MWKIYKTRLCFGLTLACSLLLVLSGCMQAGTQTHVTAGQNGPTIAETQAVHYNGPKARIAVARFTNKAGGQWYNHAIGDGMADQLATALFQTNRYIVLERQNLDVVLNEQDLGASGRIQRETAAPIGKIEGAELMIVAAVTEFSGNSGGAKGGVGGIFGRVIGGVAGGFRKAHMAIDLRIVDTRTSRILAATSVEGESKDVNIAGAIGGIFGGGALGGALAGWKNTPKEKALRQIINESVRVVVSKTPDRYYRHGSRHVRRTQKVAHHRGDHHRETVKEMQTILAHLGYDVGTPDGIAGPKTRAAIKAFQIDKGLPGTGQLNTSTIQSLRATIQ